MTHLMLRQTFSCKSDMTQFTPLTLITLAGVISGDFLEYATCYDAIFFALIAARPLGFITDILGLSSPKLEWHQAELGNIPRGAITLRPFSRRVHHYCRVIQV